MQIGRNAYKTMKQIELLSPAGSLESVRAAVQSGAGAVYMGFGKMNARRGATGFTRSEIERAIAYCRARGVKTNITMNILVNDREREEALQDARMLYEMGADAMIVQDLGLARLLRHYAPDMQLHASTQMTVHSVEGARFAKALGFSRVVLSRECTLKQIRRITAEGGIETEVFVHGALCMCYSGQCYLSSVIGRRSGNRGLCAQPCRLGYSYDNNRRGYPLSLKDLSLADWLEELQQAGVSSLKIEGRMKRPEYTAIVTEIYAKLLREHRQPSREEALILQKVFSRDGFTDGYLTGRKGDEMFGIKTDVPYSNVQELYLEAGKRFAPGKEQPLVPVDFCLFADIGGLYLRVTDDAGHEAEASDLEPVEQAQHRATTAELLQQALAKTGGTPFLARERQVSLPDGLSIPAARINALRRDALHQLLTLREARPHRIWTAAPPARLAGKLQPFKGYIMEVRTLAQVTPALLQTNPAALYIPLTELAADLERTGQLAASYNVAAVLPRICTDTEWQSIVVLLQAIQQVGVSRVVAGNVAQIFSPRRMGFSVIGDFGLNVMNSDALILLANCGVERQTVSFELHLSQIRDLAKPMDTECIVYGYLPLMIFENCAIRRKTGKCTCETQPCNLMDRTRKSFRVLPEYGCRNTLLNSQPLLLSEPKEYQNSGIAYARLRFTIESAEQCAKIAQTMVRGEPLTGMQGVTRGLYYRGVE